MERINYKGYTMWKMNAVKVLMVCVFLSLGSHAKVGVLVSKQSAMMTTPVKGIKSVLGSEILELNMNGSAATGKLHCQKFKSENCAVIIAIGTHATKVALGAGTGIPLVFCMIMNPKKAGISGSNVTGVSLDIPVTKQFEAFKSVVPSLKKIGLVYSSQVGSDLVSEMKKASSKSGFTLVEKKVASDKDVPNAIRSLKGKIDGLYLPPDRTVAKHDAFQFIALFTFENNVPFMAPTSRFVKKGALVALMIDYEEVGKQAAGIAKKIQDGSSASSIMVQPPMTTILVLNQKTAETIGINIPPSLTQTSKIIK